MNQNQRYYDPTGAVICDVHHLLFFSVRKETREEAIRPSKIFTADMYSYRLLLLIEMYTSSLHVMSTIEATAVYNKCVARAQMSPSGHRPE